MEIRSLVVGDTGIEPVTSSVSGKRATAAPIAQVFEGCRGGDGIRTRVHGFAGRCLASRPLHRGAQPADLVRADDRVRTGDLNLGKVALYQLSYVRVAPRFLGARGNSSAFRGHFVQGVPGVAN